MIDFERVESSQQDRPKEIDSESSSYFVYIRKNIEPLYEKDEEGVYLLDDDGKMIQIGWQYQEAKLLNDNYTVEKLVDHEKKLNELQADNEKLKEDNLTLMMGLADLYEVLL